MTSWPLLALDLLGVFAFGLSGGLVGVRRHVDLVSVAFLAAAAGLGGGIMRDVLIGAIPPVGISDWRLLSAAALAGAVTFFLHPRLGRVERTILFLDAAGLAFFAVAGTSKALSLGTTPLTAVVVGLLTGVGGGVLRDLLVGERPRLFSHPEWYATPALIGVSLYAAFESAGVDGPLVMWGCVLVVFVLRVLALLYDWRVPTPSRPSSDGSS